MESFLSYNWILLAAAWYGINGILHDIFVIRQHKTGYDKDLMRLLMDGHLLILSGVLMLVSWLMVKEEVLWGFILGSIVSLAMIIYVAMIFKFLKSFGTLIISFIVLIICIIHLLPFLSTA
ncbi:MAG TPA: hypothetical protein VFF90_13525 [Saprospiraceae bacterium]|nr:hypothetical protein [Saprospiraceae bacterium]